MAETSLGIHYILELKGCPFELLDDEAYVRDVVERAVYEAEATLLNLSSHKFSPQGVTAVALLAESHLSIHTWPEAGYAGVDIFTCGEAAKPELACRFLAHQLRAESNEMHVVHRGLGLECAMAETLKPTGEAKRCLAQSSQRTSG